MKTIRFFEIGILLLLLTACTLNANQEETFNLQKSLYINAINEGSTFVTVSLTYPCFVSHVKQRGADHFKSVFGYAGQDKELLGSQTIQKIVKNERNIHILFQVEIENYTSGNSNKQFVGISENDGKNWFFLPYRNYKNQHICKELKRLIN